MLPPTAIAFDLDGTLIDSRGDIVAAVNHALVKTRRAPLPAPVIVRFIGDGARALCARSAHLAEGSDAVTELVDRFTAYYLEHPLDFTRWSPGAQEMLDVFAEDMPELVLGICTNKPRVIADAVLAALGVRTRFRAVVGGGDLPEKKPAPGPLLHLARLLSAHAEATVVVGDGPQDVEAARGAGMRCVAIDAGFVPRDRLVLAHPDVLLASIAELPEVIQRWRAATARTTIGARGRAR